MEAARVWVCIGPNCRRAYSLKCNLLQHIRKKHYEIYVDVKAKRRHITDPNKRKYEVENKGEFEKKEVTLEELRGRTEHEHLTAAKHGSSQRASPDVVIPVLVPPMQFLGHIQHNFSTSVTASRLFDMPAQHMVTVPMQAHTASSINAHSQTSIFPTFQPYQCTHAEEVRNLQNPKGWSSAQVDIWPKQ